MSESGCKLLVVCVNELKREKERERGREEGGLWWEAMEQVFPRTDQEYSAYIEDEFEGRGLLPDTPRWLCIISHTRLISGPSG